MRHQLRLFAAVAAVAAAVAAAAAATARRSAKPWKREVCLAAGLEGDGPSKNKF